jgi:hypothetical protein
MMTVRAIREWLDTLSLDEGVAIDDGGLALVVVGDEETFLEVGGLPDEQ